MRGAAVRAPACRSTRAYYEIWLDEKQVAGSGEEDEPIYGPTYLPRKFKIAFAVPPINDVDVFANDLGFIAIVENGALARLQRQPSAAGSARRTAMRRPIRVWPM